MGADNRFDVFLSYNSRDHVPVEVVARWLRDQGLKVFQALGACRAAAAVFVGSREMGDWQQREQYVALERQARDSTFLVIPVLLPQADPGLGFLGQNTWVDLRECPDDPAQFALLVEGSWPPSAAARGWRWCSDSDSPASLSGGSANGILDEVAAFDEETACVG
jgi:hypothetical protein